MLFGSVPTPPKNPRSCTRTHARGGEDTERDDSRQQQRPVTAQKDDANRGECDDDKQVHGKGVVHVELPEVGDKSREHTGLRRRLHLTRHRRDLAGAVARRRCADPEAATGPRLEERHAEEVDAAQADPTAREQATRKGALGQHDQYARDHIDEDSTGCTE